MMTTKYTCKDCKFYLPVDVFKGMCKLSKEAVSPDKEATANFQKNQKCKFCANFSSSESNEFLGKCKNNYDAYPDMIAVTCDLFKWK
ncbi:MAG TPA: hypothetical protein DD381_07435 [Lentisphaeria bacterium]|nr:MAG: hypothetical protein A2X47_04015 [Lentisphaerae bacterium GWF2_38_69]HBM16154.1 hypothetical protein [Lentisphaeria bacterium]